MASPSRNLLYREPGVSGSSGVGVAVGIEAVGRVVGFGGAVVFSGSRMDPDRQLDIKAVSTRNRIKDEIDCMGFMDILNYLRIRLAYP
jgi:hypothetical protein